jgi:chemotaxis protein MotB
MAKIKALPVAPRPVEDDDEADCDCPRCPPVGAPAWMATFADMATLLMAFFVLILSFANFDEVSFKKMTGALREHFGTQIVDILPEPASTTVLDMDFRPASTPPSPQDSPTPEQNPLPTPDAPSPDPMLQQLAEILGEALENGAMTVTGDGGLVTLRLPEGAALDDLARALSDATADLADAARQQAAPAPDATAQAMTGADAGAEGSDTAPGSAGSDATTRAAIAEARLKVALRELEGEGLVDVQQQQDKVIVTVGSGGAFTSGSADLTDDAREIMARIALTAAGSAEQIVVTGHTDGVPLSGGPFVDNWGLAAARASAVVRELGAQGAIDPARLSAVSKGESAPLADNATEQGRATNRRIEIVFDFAAAAP